MTDDLDEIIDRIRVTEMITEKKRSKGFFEDLHRRVSSGTPS